MFRLLVLLSVRALMKIVNGIGGAVSKRYWNRVNAATPSLPQFMLHDSTRMIGRLMVDIGTVGRAPFVQVRAHRLPCRVPRLVRERAWAERDRPRAAPTTLPPLDADTRGDDAAARALPAFDGSWDALGELVEHALLVSDGEQVIGWIVADREEQVERLVRTVVAVARWDVSFATLLDELPGARAIDDAVLAPAVLLPGDIRVGLRGDDVLVSAGTTTRKAVRDRASILAIVEELRAAQASGPFR